MPEIPILQDIVIIFGVSIAVLLVCHRIGIPSIVGFLLTGIIIGPSALGFVKSVHEVEVLAEIGVILLLFSIGIEFSFRNLIRVKKPVLLGGSLQVFLTIGVFLLISWRLGLNFSESFFVGCLMALSSTAIVLRLLQERAETASPHGRVVLSVLIFQDIIIVPMMIFTPFLAGSSENPGSAVIILIAKAVAVILLIILLARYIVPALLYQITRTQSRELFLLTTVTIGIAVAWLTSRAGLSLGLGAFLAGLVISESEYSHQALDGIVPFKDIFTSFFFVSVGMLLDISFLINHPLLIIGGAILVLFAKSIVTCAVALILGMSTRAAIITGLALGQVGEFSFILSRVGIKFDLIGGDIYQQFIAVSVLTMGATPFLIAAAPKIADIISPWPILNKFSSGSYLSLEPIDESRAEKLNDHLVIIGFGINGRNVARAAGAAGIKYAVVEMNPDTVRIERQKGEMIFYGDASSASVFEKVGLSRARILVVTIADPAASRRITVLARKINPHLHIIVRTRFVQEMKGLYELGANDVIPEEFETSIEIFTIVLMKYLVPRDEISKFISDIRADKYQIFRGLSRYSSKVSDLKLQFGDIDVCVLKVAENSPIMGDTLAAIDLRRKHGITVLAIKRGEEVIASPGGSTEIKEGDLFYLLGGTDKINEFRKLIFP
jgi:CPA2 family monovalent cation:H+ antiporter-2